MARAVDVAFGAFACIKSDETMTEKSWRLTVQRPRIHLVSRARRLLAAVRAADVRWRLAVLSRGIVARGLSNGSNVDAARAPAIEIPTYVGNPLISIIIPFFNNVSDIYRCLSAVCRHTAPGTFEVIVADDASDATARRLLHRMTRNATIVHNAVNLGYIRNRNAAAAHARGEFLVFLNQDTVVGQNWLGPMLELAQADAEVACVGPKLLYPDGRLQEAGAIVWSDMNATNFGRGDDPEKPEYNYVRQVDYCSGACLLVRADVFRRLGGFDESLAPAYGDDADFALAARQAGYKVIYQPLSTVLHTEGASMGTDPRSGLKAYQSINKTKLLQKWSAPLAGGYYPCGQHVFLARERHSGPRLLFIDRYVPMWDIDSGSNRMYEYLRIFTRLGFKIVLWPDDLLGRQPYTTALQQLGVEVLYGWLDFERYVKHYGRYFAVVYGCRASVMERYIRTLRRSRHPWKIVYDSHDLSFLRERRRAALENSERRRVQTNVLERLERFVMERSDAVVAVSAVERELIQSWFPDKPCVLLQSVYPTVAPVNGFAERRDLLFLGGFDHQPNVDAMQWFVSEVLPLIHQTVPHLELEIVGSNPPPAIRCLASSSIHVTGYVKDLSPCFEARRIFVAPLRYGAGEKGKIANSLSHGVPVVTTSAGTEGMSLVDGTHVLVADTAEGFAQRVCQLYRDSELWMRMSQAGLAYAAKFHGRDVMASRIQALFRTLDVLP